MDHSYATIEAQIRHAKQMRSAVLGILLGELLAAGWQRVAAFFSGIAHHGVTATALTTNMFTRLHPD